MKPSSVILSEHQLAKMKGENFMPSRYEKIPAGAGTKRDTPKILIERVLELVKENGYYQEVEPILDYYSPSKTEIEFSNYEFDFCALVNPGGSEGIYIDVFLKGKFDQSGQNYCQIATFKTLREDAAAFKIMGALCGVLTYYAGQYINSNLVRYYTPNELEAWEKRQSEKHGGQE